MLTSQENRVRIAPDVTDQIDDLRLLQNAGLWEIANRSKALVLHSPISVHRISAESGVQGQVLPFANYRRPEENVITQLMRRDARDRLGFNDELIHIASFGFIDFRTKQSDVVVEAAAWLTQWGHRVSLHLVGAAPESLEKELISRAAVAGIEEFQITGFVDDQSFRDFVLGIDVGVQLRVSPLLGVSGPLSDMAAYGTPAVANRGICIDVDTPAFIDRLPDDVSPVMVAEALEQRILNPHDPVWLEEQRTAYLEAKSPERYAQDLLSVLSEVARS